MSAILPDTQVLDIAKRCGLNRHLSGAAAEAVLVEFATLVREAEPLAAGDVFGKTEILHRPGGQVDPCMALPHVRTEAAPAPNTAGSATGFHLAKMSRDEVIKIMIKRDMLSQHGYRTLLNGDFISLNLDHLTALANAALARATPQHSVTEQAAAAWIDEFGNVWPLGAYSPSGKPSYHDAHKRGWKPLFRAQPLASPAATQPEQASDFAVRFIEQRAQKYLDENAHSDWDTGSVIFNCGEAGQDYYNSLVELADDLRAALAIPASTAASEQQSVANINIGGCPFCGKSGTCASDCAASEQQATIPSEADEHEDFDRWADERLFSNPPLPVTAFDAWKAARALAHRATTATKR